MIRNKNHFEIDISSFLLIFSLGNKAGADAISKKNIIVTRLLKLTITSVHGNPLPSVGSHNYNSGSTVTCIVPSPVKEGKKIWICTDWTGTGSVPSSGKGTSITFVILQNSSIIWNWWTWLVKTGLSPEYWKHNIAVYCSNLKSYSGFLKESGIPAKLLETYTPISLAQANALFQAPASQNVDVVLLANQYNAAFGFPPYVVTP